MVQVIKTMLVIWAWTTLQVSFADISDFFHLIYSEICRCRLLFVWIYLLDLISLFLLCFCRVSFYVAGLMFRYTTGECCLTEETPPVLSTTPPPGRLLLFADRHAGRSRALRPLPQCGHQEELHSVTPAPSHFPQSRGSKRREVLASRYCPKVNKRQVRCCRRLLTRLHLYHRRDLLLADQ